ncbi:peptide deformylase [Oscillatoria amoena NRMC-F 0135]|nr:peptide deformylase [Oscillatoria laete-virens]MDL5049114.1 peptide deformylase [Oscillatoria amoena NRMC-F 0135]MDL5054002.1 peptide deformylase [Oscillatoria laete-virens NRMC-F 0139]
MTLEIVRYGHPTLREKAPKLREIPADLEEFARDMLETMYEAQGVGLAAQQVGSTLRICVIDITGADRPSKMWFSGVEVDPEDYMPLILINPVVKVSGDNLSGPEGCLSFPGIGGNIIRPAFADVEALKLDGSLLSFKCAGLLSRAVQHEVDHLDGVLFIDRMIQRDKEKAKPAIRELLRQTKADLDAKKRILS